MKRLLGISKEKRDERFCLGNRQNKDFKDFKSRWKKNRTNLIKACGENGYNNAIFDKGFIISNHVSFLFID